MTDRLNCSFCVFYEGPRSDSALGNCRKMPPVFVGMMAAPDIKTGGNRPVPVFSPIKVRSKHDWCGQFEEIPTEGSA